MSFVRPTSLRSDCLVLMVAVFAIAGCGPESRTSGVTGTVTFEGAAVPEGTITFYPKAGGRPAIGQIQSDGTYELSTFAPGDGAVPGEHKVAIEAKQVSGAGAAPTSLQDEIAQTSFGANSKTSSVNWLVPEKYASSESSELTATVESGSNKIDFQLP